MSMYKSRAKSAVKASSRRESLPAELSRVNLERGRSGRGRQQPLRAYPNNPEHTVFHS